VSNSLFVVGLPIALTLVLMACRMPVAFALGLSGGFGIALLEGGDVASSTVAAIPFTTTASYTLTLVPMFILLGMVISHAGLIDAIFDVAARMTRRLPGGLGVATVAACTFFGGISGSSVADAATIGRFAIPELAKRGYTKAYAASIVAASATVDILIPPSIVLVIYGIVSGESVGALLLAGIVPGLVTAVVYCVIVMFKGRSPRVAAAEPDIGGYDYPVGSVGGGGVVTATRAPSTVTEPVATDTVATPPPSVGRVDRVTGVLAGALLFGVVVGGIYAGVFTATEAAAVGAVVSIVISSLYVLLSNRPDTPGLGRLLGGSLSETAALTSSIFSLVVGATIFTQFLVLAGVPEDIGNWVTGLDVSPHLVVIFVLIALVPLGMFLDGLSMMLIVCPIFHPTIVELGFNGVWFGILFVVMIEISLLTPPVGMNVFVVSGLFRDVRAEDVFRSVMPFIGAQLVVVAILFVFPDIVTFLPDLAAENSAGP
jgi:C4-dicarboxylate transporter, DctM subunit